MSDFRGLVDRHRDAAMRAQTALSHRIGDHEWRLEVDRGVIVFNEDVTYDVQLLGTESGVSGTWLWAWANDDVEDDVLLRDALALRHHGREAGIAELTDPKASLEQVEGYAVGALAVGIAGATAHYRCPHEAGVVVVALHDAAAGGRGS